VVVTYADKVVVIHFALRLRAECALMMFLPASKFTKFLIHCHYNIEHASFYCRRIKTRDINISVIRLLIMLMVILIS